jgi:hypothetical protein
MIGPLKSKEPHLRSFFSSAGDMVPSKTVRSLTVRIYVLFLYWVGSGVSEVVALPREPKISDRSSDASEE